MGPDDITPEWLSGVLDADVRSVSTERIGDGLVGLNLRVDLETAADDDATPSSVVIKLPSLDETSKATGVALRNYEREVKFYEFIAHTVDIRVPHCHHGEWDADTGDFVLVLEDMAPAAQGDQIVGCSVEVATDAVLELAKLHGPRWGDDTLAEHEFLGRRTAEDVAQLEGLWQMFLPGFLTTYTPHLSADALDLLDRFGSRLVAWVESRGGPLTVTHGDYRLDNLMFATPEGGPAVTAVDWQTPGHGPAAGDLAYFCGAGLLPEDRRRAERSLVDSYVGALAGYGIEIDASWMWDQYRREAFGGVIMAVVASQVVGGSDRSESMFAAMATRHLQHALDLDAIETIG